MSFSEICDKFGPVVSHLRKGEKTIQSISSLFKSYKKIIESGNSQLQKALETFRLELPKENNLDTLSTALMSLLEYFNKLISSSTIYSRSIGNEIIEPLDLFLTQFSISCTDLSNKGQNLVREVTKAREKNNKLKEKYFQACEQLEKCERAEKSCFEENKEKFEKLQRATNAQRLAVTKNFEAYSLVFKELESSCDKYDALMPGIMESLQKSNESRIHFTKYSFEKQTKSHQRCLESCQDCINDFLGIVSNVNSNIDIRVFVDSNKSKQKPARDEFMKYEAISESKIVPKQIEEKVKEDDYEVIENTPVKPGQDPDTELVEQVLEHLIPADSEFSLIGNLDSSFYSKISELLHTPDGRGIFCDVLETKRSRSLLQYSKATQLAALIKSFLTSMMMQEDIDSVVFCKIVVLAHVFYTEDESGKRKYLTHFLESHAIWQEQNRWIEAIEAATYTKVQADQEHIRSLPKKKKGLLGILKNIGKAAFLKNSQEDEREFKLVAFMIMGQFNFHMIHLGLPQEVSNSIVLNFCKKVELDQERTCNLLAELQANQKINTKPERYKLSLQLREKEKTRWDKLLPIGLALDFLRPNECFELMLVNKAWNSMLRIGIFKKWLLEWGLEGERKIMLRTRVWIDVLKADSRPIDYFSLLEKVSSEQLVAKSLTDIIDIDVARSYQGNDMMPPQILKNLLKTYAYYNEEIGYCQGMNYIVGSIFLQVRDEAMAFKILVSLIDKFQMKTLFISSLPKLKQFFYQLDRIIGLFLPELHEKFKEISIISGHFSSSWFITLYSSVLQNKPELLYQIWDMFILEGWKTIFKVAVAILSKLSRSIVAGRFEDIMLILTNFQMLGLGGEVFEGDFIGRVQQVNISNALLRDLESEYEHLKLKASTSSKILYT